MSAPESLRTLAGCFEGLRVLDLTQNLPGPYCTMLLRSLGADVVKVEPPRGEPARNVGRIFAMANRGKRSIALNLKSEDGVARLHELIGAADVVVEGFRPGVMARFGASADDALKLNPRVIYCSISGLGQGGPHRDRPGHDLNFQAMTGVCHMMRSADDTPRGAALPIADLSSSLTAFAAINAALYARERDGKGRKLDVALADTVASWAHLWSEGLTPRKLGLEAGVPAAREWLTRRAEKLPGPLAGVGRWLSEQVGGDKALAGAQAVSERLESSDLYARLGRVGLHALPHYGIYRTQDEQWLSVGIVDEDKFWRELCGALGVPLLGDLPLPARFLAGPALRRTLTPIFARKPLAHWMEHIDPERVPIAPVLRVDEALEHPQLLARYGGWTHPTLPSPFVLEPGLKSPKLDADHDAVLRDWLGTM